MYNMVQIVCSIRYHSQLSRIRPDTLKRLENDIKKTIISSGGAFTFSAGKYVGKFDDSITGFWLDATTILESIQNAFSEADRELFGRVCLIMKDEGTRQMQDILRTLANEECPSGIWCERCLVGNLKSFVSFGSGEEWLPLLNFSYFSDLFEQHSWWDRLKSTELLRNGLTDNKASKALLVCGPDFSGKRHVIGELIREKCKEFPSLHFRFGTGSCFFAALADACSIPLLSALDSRASEAWLNKKEEYKRLIRLAKQKRFSNELSTAFKINFKDFLSYCIQMYAEHAASNGVPAFLVLENIHVLDKEQLVFVCEAASKAVEAGSIRIIGSANDAGAASAIKLFSVHTIYLDMPGLGECQEIARYWRQILNVEPTKSNDALELSRLAENGGIPAVYRAAIGWEQDTKGRPRKMHPRCSVDLVEFAYALDIASKFVPPQKLAQLFIHEGKSDLSWKRALKELFALGLILSEENPQGAFGNFSNVMEKILGDRSSLIRSMVREGLLRELKKGELLPSYGLLKVLESLGDECGDSLALESIENELHQDTVSEIRQDMSSGVFTKVVGQSRSKILAYIVRVRSALNSRVGDEQLPWYLEQAFSAVVPSEYPSVRYEASVMLDLAAYSYSREAIPECAKRAKDAMILLQNIPDGKGISRAYRQLGLAELASERLSEAMDYFRFASESAESRSDLYELILDDAYTAIAQFIHGNLSLAEQYGRSVRERSATVYAVTWDRWIQFFNGRLLFECGRYREAGLLFQKLLEECPDAEHSAERRTLFAWAYRARLYSRSLSLENTDYEADGDLGLFTVEERYFSGEYRQALELAESLLVREKAPLFSSPEQPDWTSGFSMIENRCMRGENVRKKLLRVYKNLCLLGLNEKDEACEDLRCMIREERLSELDPHDPFYFRAYRIALHETNAPAVDQGTILSLAFKRLQRRASRIDDVELKRSYLTLPRWNASLFADAKANNLI
jgi:tetratricopeptide (TPR) repeat protein